MIEFLHLEYLHRSLAHNRRIIRIHHRSITMKAAERSTPYKTALEFKDKPVKAYSTVFAGSECLYCG